MASDGKKRAGPRPCSDFLMSARNPRLLHGTNGLVRGVGGGKPRRRASSSQDLDHAWGRREPVFRLVLRRVTLARRHFQIKHNATITTGNATAGGDEDSAATLAHRCDTVMTPTPAPKALSALVFSPLIRFVSLVSRFRSSLELAARFGSELRNRRTLATL